MKVKTLPLIFLIAATVASQSIGDEIWVEFKNVYSKSYDSIEEDLSRKLIFNENLRKIKEHNRLYDIGEKTFTLEMNKFGDLTTEEFKKFMTRREIFFGKTLDAVQHIPHSDNLLTSIDWRTKGAVTGVKDQGQFGSCSVFSAVGALEGLWFLHNSTLVDLSVQNLIDCFQDECSSPDGVFKYVSEHGINTATDYPTDGKFGKCRSDEEKAILLGVKYVDLPVADETALASAVANVEPVAAVINAGEFSFQFYGAGIYYDSNCSPSNLDHSVLVVGYGSSSASDYWIVKNSWGVNWGQAGYILMARNKNNNCGIASMASYPYL
uniref:Cathepsin L9 n=1 Tax=Dysdercus peruvianus TaxID=685034 RepID=A0A7U3RVR7_9HEMI|nr:cathepsin L9 [Dysdercus peruvianus]